MRSKISYIRNFFYAFTLIFLGCSTEDLGVDQPLTRVDLEVLQYNEWKMAEEILILINEYRSSISKSAIEFNRNSPTALAIDHCQFMIEKDSISHANFSKRNKALLEIGATMVGENIAYGFALSNSVVNAWIHSLSHKLILEGNYSHVGIGVVNSSNNKNYITALFYLK